MSAGALRLAPARRGDLGPARRILAEAFVDDPVWAAIGPRRRRHRAIACRASFWAILGASFRHRAQIEVAHLGGRPAGVTISFAHGDWPIPDSAALRELAWAAVAGPAPVLRGFRDDRTMRAAHLSEPHHYLWFIAVDPAHQGTGIGRALLASMHARSDASRLPAYLETATEINRRLYESVGYEAIGELRLPSGPLMWQMKRRAAD